MCVSGGVSERMANQSGSPRATALPCSGTRRNVNCRSRTTDHKSAAPVGAQRSDAPTVVPGNSYGPHTSFTPIDSIGGPAMTSPGTRVGVGTLFADDGEIVEVVEMHAVDGIPEALAKDL